MVNISKNSKNSNFSLTSGALNERHPLIKNGLVVHFPFDGENKGLLTNLTDKLNPTFESNLSVNYKEGLGIAESTTNLVSTINSTWNNWSGLDGSYGSYNNLYNRKGVHIKVYTNGGVQYYYTNGAITVLPSTTYTISATIKNINIPPSTNMFYIREYNSSGVQVREMGVYNHSQRTYLQSNWYKAFSTFTTTSTTTTLTVTGYEYTAGVELYIEDIQLEQKSFHTSYVLDSRPSNSNLKLSIPGNLTTYSIVGKFLPHTPFDGTYNQTTEYSHLFMIGDTAEAGHVYYRYYVSGNTSLPYLDPDGTFASGTDHIHAAYNVLSNNYIYYLIRKNGTSFECKLFQNNVLLGTHAYTTPYNTQLSYISLGESPVWNGDHKSLTVYNRIISDDEINLIMNVKQEYESNGDLNCYVNEDFYPNLWPNADLSTTTYGVQGSVSPVLKTDSYGTYHEMSYTNSTWTYKGYDIPTISGSTYIFSGMFWLSSGNTFDYVVLSIEGATSSSGGISCGSLPTDQWVYAQMSCVADDNIRCLIYPSGGTSSSGTIKWRNMCVRLMGSDEIILNKDSELIVGEYHE